MRRKRWENGETPWFWVKVYLYMAFLAALAMTAIYIPIHFIVKYW